MDQKPLDRYIDLLKEKNVILEKILQYTKSKTFKIHEDEVERIVYFLNTRQTMYDKASSIQRRIKFLEKSLFDEINHKDVVELNKKNDIIIRELSIIDENNKKSMQSILELLRLNIKSIKATARVNNVYFGGYESNLGGNYFDSSR